MPARRHSVSLNTIDADPREIVEAARAADAADVHAIYCYDHISGASFHGESSLHIWSVLGAIAATTRRVHLGPLVANVTTRHAVDIALASATLQQLSAGRLLLGLGAGAGASSEYAAEMHMFALPLNSAARRRERVADAVAFLNALWNDEPRFRSTNFSFDEPCGISAPDPRCPILIGANGPKLAELAATIADGLNVHWWQPGIDNVIAIARLRARQRRLEAFTVSVEVPLDAVWLDEHAEWLDRLDVDEVIYSWHADLAPEAIARLVR